MSQDEIAQEIGTIQSAISRINRGKQLDLQYTVGSKLIALHADRINKKVA